jgi:hypothetical protein
LIKTVIYNIEKKLRSAKPPTVNSNQKKMKRTLDIVVAVVADVKADRRIT